MKIPVFLPVTREFGLQRRVRSRLSPPAVRMQKKRFVGPIRLPSYGIRLLFLSATHCRLAGKPARAAAFARFVDHDLRHDGVWICRRSEIAEHWRRQHPATGKKG
jgi:hypothetical protein